MFISKSSHWNNTDIYQALCTRFLEFRHNYGNNGSQLNCCQHHLKVNINLVPKISKSIPISKERCMGNTYNVIVFVSSGSREFGSFYVFVARMIRNWRPHLPSTFDLKLICFTKFYWNFILNFITTLVC